MAGAVGVVPQADWDGQMRTARAIVVVAALALLSPAQATAQMRPPHQQLAYDIYKQLIEINTTDSVGNTTVAAEAMAARFRAAGFPAVDVFVGGPNPRKGNLVVRYRG